MERQSVKEIEELLKAAPLDEIPALTAIWEQDERSGVQKLLRTYRKRKEQLDVERERMKKMFRYEHRYREYHAVCGIDEVGRGPLAGPVTACAVILPKDCSVLGLNDSKQLSEKRREALCEVILKEAVSVGIGTVSPAVIDDINILQATYEAMRIAVGNLSCMPDLLLNDAVTIPGLTMRQIPIIKGDAKSASIAAASIVAKVTRDRMMKEYDQVFPGYGFAENKGYGSAAHIEALRRLGPCPIHRRTFIRNMIT